MSVFLTYRPQRLEVAWDSEAADAFLLQPNGALWLLDEDGQRTMAGAIAANGEWQVAAERRREPRFFADANARFEIRVGHTVSASKGAVLQPMGAGRLMVVELHEGRLIAESDGVRWRMPFPFSGQGRELTVCLPDYPLLKPAPLGKRGRLSTLAG